MLLPVADELTTKEYADILVRTLHSTQSWWHRNSLARSKFGVENCDICTRSVTALLNKVMELECLE